MRDPELDTRSSQSSTGSLASLGMTGGSALAMTDGEALAMTDVEG